MDLKLSSVDWQQKPNKRERTMFLVALVVFLFGFMKACWLPSRQAIDELHDAMNKAEQEKRVATQLRTTPAASTAPTAAPTSNMPKLAAGTIKDVEGAVQAISEPLLLNGVVITGFKQTELQREGNFVRQQVELNLQGNFFMIGGYLEALEKLPAPLVIEDFSMSLGDDKSSKITVALKGSFYGKD